MKNALGHLSISLAVAVTALTGCTTTQELKPVAPAEIVYPELRVGVTPLFPPLIYREGQELKGMEVAFAQALGEALDRPIEFVPLKWDQQIPALQQGQVDILMTGLLITRQRAMEAAFTEPYLRVGQMLLIRSQDAERFRYPHLITVSKARIGVQRESRGDRFVQEQCLAAKRVPFRSARQAAEALKAGRVDAVIHDAPVVWLLASENEAAGLEARNTPLTEEYLAWAVRRDNRPLLDSVNAVRNTWARNGMLESIVTNWMP